LIVTYNLCMSPSTADPSSYQFQTIVTNTSGSGNYGAPKGLSTLSTCPAMTAITTPVIGGSLVATAVNNIGLTIASLGSGPFGTATIQAHSITAPNSLVGPYG